MSGEVRSCGVDVEGTPALLDFAVNRVFTHDGVVFFQLHAVRRIFTVFLRHVTRSSGQAAVFVLSALQNDLDTVAFAFLCHILRCTKC